MFELHCADDICAEFDTERLSDLIENLILKHGYMMTSHIVWKPILVQYST